jgi:hypothetical protein
MGSGIAFPDAKSALTAEYKKSGNIDAFLTTLVSLAEQITGKTITFSDDE